MYIAIVSNYPPAGRPVSEYCFHLVEALRGLGEISRITVLADSARGVPTSETFGKVTIRRCWDFNSYSTLPRLLATIKSIKPDVCWFNITLGSFGMSTANFPVLLAPVLLKRFARLPTIVTLHNIVDLTDVKEINLRGGKLAIFGAKAATWLLCRASLVCVLLPEYESILRGKYGVANVCVVPHGTLGRPVCYPNGGAKQLLCFGIFGTHKKLEVTLAAMRLVHTQDSEIRLVVVGGSNAHSPDYLVQLQQRLGRLPNVDFIGYVPENCVPKVFAESAAVILPYATIGGESGTLVQAGMYARAILVSDLPFFRRKVGAGYYVNFFDPRDPVSISTAILDLLHEGPEVLAEQGLQNFRAATACSMSEVARIYFNLVEQLLSGVQPTPSMCSHRRESLGGDG